MEDGLGVDERPLDPTRPVVCLDEPSRQRRGAARPPLPPAPGRIARHDPAYLRGGVAHRLLVPEPLRGWCDVRVSAQRTRRDGAACVPHLADGCYPAAERIVLVRDQRNPQLPASRDAAVPAAAAKRLADKLEIHYTPKHGSWLNMAELELAVLQRQCLTQRFGAQTALERAAMAWATRRNAVTATIDWRFTTADARIKLKRLYPAIEP
jgi:DDE superfamily endonuclease